MVLTEEVNRTENNFGGTAKKTKADIWKEAVNQLIDPTTGMSEAEKASYRQRILQKLRSGKRLSSEELDFLRVNDPQLYQIAMRVEMARRALQTKLKACKSKEQVQEVQSVQIEALRAMKDSPDAEYMAAMVKQEMESFKKSSDYARLPEKTDKKKGKNNILEAVLQGKKKEGQEEAPVGMVSVYRQTQFQCEMISQMTQAFE